MLFHPFTILKIYFLQRLIKHPWKEPDVTFLLFFLSIGHRNSLHQKAPARCFWRLTILTVGQQKTLISFFFLNCPSLSIVVKLVWLRPKLGTKIGLFNNPPTSLTHPPTNTGHFQPRQTVVTNGWSYQGVMVGWWPYLGRSPSIDNFLALKNSYREGIWLTNVIPGKELG